MSDEQFEANGIKRTNRERRETEQRAQANRASSPVRQNQVDQSSPAFPQNRPNYSGGGGGGAINPLTILMLFPLGIVWLRRRIIDGRS